MLTYYHLWKMNPTEARRILVKDYQETQSYSQTAKNFSTHRRIVRKWVLRYRDEGERGLESLPPIPSHGDPVRKEPTYPPRPSAGEAHLASPGFLQFRPQTPPLLAKEEPPNRDSHLYHRQVPS